jgi:hypothetical protein
LPRGARGRVPLVGLERRSAAPVAVEARPIRRAAAVRGADEAVFAPGSVAAAVRTGGHAAVAAGSRRRSRATAVPCTLEAGIAPDATPAALGAHRNGESAADLTNGFDSRGGVGPGRHDPCHRDGKKDRTRGGRSSEPPSRQSCPPHVHTNPQDACRHRRLEIRFARYRVAAAARDGVDSSAAPTSVRNAKVSSAQRCHE